ncbi:cytochrome P450 [Kitasatospora sp. NPDC001175]|uniref:cytochrome P450 n=1 Tax=Kitasatospora sp. NPDC001175 TaxID=3157103 RepID=UPI003D063187
MSALAGNASDTGRPPVGGNPAHPEFWSLPAQERAAAFTRLRALERPPFCTDPRTGRGFHALVRHADVVTASRTPEIFVSAPGVTTPEPARWVRALFGDSMVNLDDPRHADLRRIVSRAFTPRLIIETTRNALAHGLHLLTVHPDQRELLLSDLDRHLGGAVEEIVRYATPIIQFRRTLAADHRLGGAELARDEKVVLFFGSANRDEAVFTDPDTFDVTRSPNPHLGFGGGGPHFCLGAYLARQEMKVLLRELYTRLPGLRSVGEPELIPSSFDNRVRSLGFTFTPPAR